MRVARRSVRPARASVLVSALAACAAPSYDDLPPCDSLPMHRELAAKSAALAGYRARTEGVSYRQTRGASSDWLVVLIHGVLSDSRAWTYVAGDLGQDHDLLILDLPGCGDSDKPQTSSMYTPDALARKIYTVLRVRLAEEPRRVALVGHSLGSMIILRMLGDEDLRTEFADVRDQVGRIVLMSPVDFAVEQKHPGFERIIGLSGFEVALADLLAILKETAGRAVENGTDHTHRVPKEEAERLVQILRNPVTRFAAQQMLKQAVPFNADERPDWPRIERLVADYGNVDVPCQLIVGSRDETFPAAMSYKLAAQLPYAELIVLPMCMHGLPSEAPRECARLVRGWLHDEPALPETATAEVAAGRR